MHAGRLGQSLQVIAALEQADHAVAGAAVGDLVQAARRPVEVLGDKVDLRQRIAVVGIEAGRDQDEIRRKFVSADSTRERNASRKCSLPALGESGALTMLPFTPVSSLAPVPG